MPEVFSFSEKEMQEPEFQSVMSCFSVDGRWFHNDKALFEKAMRSVTQLPTGRMMMRSVLFDVNERRKTDPSYKITIDMRSDKDDSMGRFSIEENDRILIFPNVIDREITKSIEDENVLPDSDIAEHAQSQALGVCVLHELAHLRQENESLLTNLRETKDPILSRYGFVYADAETQALSRQLSLESINPAVRKMWGISFREREDYLTKTMRQRQDMRAVSISNQAGFMQDFITPLNGRVGYTYASLANRFEYMRMSGCLEELVDSRVAVLSGKKEEAQGETDIVLQERLRNRFRSMYGRSIPGQIRFEELLPSSLIDRLVQEVITEGKPSLKAADSKQYQMAIDRLEQSLYLLQEVSPEIYDGKEDYRDISKEQRALLEKDFGIQLNEKNKKGELIASHAQNLSEELRTNAEAVPSVSNEQVIDLLNNSKINPLV